MQMERRRFWMGHVARFHASGLTRRQYCDRHCLAPATLDYWRRRARMEPAPAFVPPTCQHATQQLPSFFIYNKWAPLLEYTDVP